jgi:hypothetical protein
MRIDIKEVQIMWQNGLSTARIGARFGVTRNSIAGAIFRAREQGMVFEPRPAAASSLKTRTVTGDAHVDYFEGLRHDSCRFIINDDTTRPIFCRDPVHRVSYCAAHYAICYVPPRGRS